jgi:hypothetical protein
MSQIWQPRDGKRFARWAKKGVTVYTIENIERRIAPYEDTQLYSVHTATWSSPITGSVMFGHMSARTLCENFGPVYDSPPPGVRPMAGPGPQVAPPVSPNEIHILDEPELRGLEKRAIEAERERRETAAKQARRRWSLFH